MASKLFFRLVLVLLFASVALAGGKKAPTPSTETAGTEAPHGVTGAPASGDTVWVFRPDGAKSCEPGSGQKLEAGAEELKQAKVHVLDSRKGNDGKMHVQVCGAATGSQNTYLIPRADLPLALAAGFHEKK